MTSEQGKSNARESGLEIQNLSIWQLQQTTRLLRKTSCTTHYVFRNLSMAIPLGDIVGLMGPSGSGKSTLLMWIAGLLDQNFHADGRLLLKTQDLSHLPAERRNVGVLFQDHLLFPHLSVAGNLAFGLAAHIRGQDRRRAAIDSALAAAQLTGLGDRDPMSLSGGQQARVALMRTLLAEPHVLLLDEPFGKLDAELRAEFRDFVFAEVRRRNLPTLLVSHDLADMATLPTPPLQLSDYTGDAPNV